MERTVVRVSSCRGQPERGDEPVARGHEVALAAQLIGDVVLVELRQERLVVHVGRDLCAQGRAGRARAFGGSEESYITPENGLIVALGLA